MGLRDDILHEPISELALKPLLSVPVGMTVRRVVTAMRRRKMGSAVVMEDGANPVGFFNERLLMHMLVNETGTLDSPVDQVMSDELITLSVHDPIAKLIVTMQERKLRWICVTDDAGRAHSITGCKNLFEYLVDHFPRHVKVRPLRSIMAMEQREGA